jgi:hypothetical protein
MRPHFQIATPMIMQRSMQPLKGSASIVTLTHQICT